MNIATSQPSLTQYRLWTALITPFDQAGNIDFDSLKSIAIQQAQAGNALLLLGSTGEGLALSMDEQLSIVRAVSELALGVPLMVAVGGFQLLEQELWIEQCNKLNIDAYLLGSPLYAKPGPIGQQHWFEALLNKADYPCMLYNVPSRSGVNLSANTLAKLQHHPRCWALKEASGDINQFLAYREACPDMVLFSGEDGLMPYLAPAGAYGLVSVCANAWPKQTHAYVQQCIAQQVDTLFPVWKQAVEALFSVANPIPVKILMAKNEHIQTPVLRPPLTPEELLDDSTLIQANQQIDAWYLKHQSAEPTSYASTA